MYENINFINYLDNNFFQNFSDVIIIGGNKYNINLEEKVKKFNNVIRIHNYRAINQTIDSHKNGIYTKTDYIYTWMGRALEFSKEGLNNNQLQKKIINRQYTSDNCLNKYIPELKGIISYVDPYSECDFGCDTMSKKDKVFIKNVYNKNIISNNRFPDDINLYLEYISEENKYLPTKPNDILKKLNIPILYPNGYGASSGMRCIFQIINCGIVPTILGFTLETNHAELINQQKLKQSNIESKLCKGRCCGGHCAITEVKILNYLINNKLVKILE